MRKLLPNLRISSGFSLMELMVVMTIITILVTMALYGFSKAQQSARDSARQQMITGIASALERYYGDNQGYPGTTGFNSLVTALCGNVGYGSPCSLTISYLTNAPTDPNKTCTTTYAAAWQPCTTAQPTYYYEQQANGQCWNGQGTQPALANAYQLRLAKESGGTSYFCSPQ